ncbi:unnamed protein product [Closterium sp. Naga37s-1]|nr:unnamed protein product [Closterium sp. Naga37s-1]
MRRGAAPWNRTPSLPSFLHTPAPLTVVSALSFTRKPALPPPRPCYLPPTLAAAGGERQGRGWFSWGFSAGGVICWRGSLLAGCSAGVWCWCWRLVLVPGARGWRWCWCLVLAAGAGAWCWCLVLAAGAGAWCWRLALVLVPGAGGWCWCLVLAAGAGAGAWCWRLTSAHHPRPQLLPPHEPPTPTPPPQPSPTGQHTTTSPSFWKWSGI